MKVRASLTSSLFGAPAASNQSDGDLSFGGVLADVTGNAAKQSNGSPDPSGAGATNVETSGSVTPAFDAQVANVLDVQTFGSATNKVASDLTLGVPSVDPASLERARTGVTLPDTTMSDLKMFGAKRPDIKLSEAKAPETKSLDTHGASERFSTLIAPANAQVSTKAQIGVTASGTSPAMATTAKAKSTGRADVGNGDQTVSTNAFAPAAGSLLALVQIAAIPASATNAETPTAPASNNNVATLPGAALLGQTDPVSLLVKEAPVPLISDVTFQNHLAPVVATPTVASGGERVLPSAQDVLPSVTIGSTVSRTATSAPTSTLANVGDAKDAGVSSAVPQAGVASISLGGAQNGQSGGDASNGRGTRNSSAPEKLPIDQSVNPTGVVAQADASAMLDQRATLAAPTKTVADAVVTLASQAAAAAHSATPNSVAPARTMLLQLSPEGLGTVSVRLHLTGQTLDVSLSASHSVTAAVLDRDRAALTSALGDRDYHLNSLSIQGGDAASTPGGSNASTDTSSHRAASGSFGESQSGGNGRGASRDPSARQRQDAEPASRPSSLSRGDALFV